MKTAYIEISLSNRWKYFSLDPIEQVQVWECKSNPVIAQQEDIQKIT